MQDNPKISSDNEGQEEGRRKVKDEIWNNEVKNDIVSVHVDRYIYRILNVFLSNICHTCQTVYSTYPTSNWRHSQIQKPATRVFF